MVTVRAYGAVSSTAPLEPVTIERRDLGPHDVFIDIEYAGICHSDIHTVRGEWGPITYPQVVGHEIVGTVAEVGSEVTRHRVGDRVGVGCQSNSCRECEQCRQGQDQYCLNGNVQTYNGIDIDGSITQGGYSQATVIDEDFVLSVPDGLDAARVAPLLCAGITTYSPLRHWNTGPGMRVAVIGMGGLGHMAVKIAAAMGAEVTVLSRTLAKKNDGLNFGARGYYATEDRETFRNLQGTFDLMINTVSAQLNIMDYIRLLAVDGTLVNVGAAPGELGVAAGGLIGGRRSLAGSATGGIPEIQEMLEFCADHGIMPETELIGAESINDAYERVLTADVRYRFVIDAKSFD